MRNLMCNLLIVSTHSPARGLTVISADTPLPIDVSTHSPARGLTRRPWQLLRQKKRFNSQPRKGADKFTTGVDTAYSTFQLTAPQGG